MCLDEELYAELWGRIVPMADHMRNIEGNGDPTEKCP